MIKNSKGKLVAIGLAGILATSNLFYSYADVNLKNEIIINTKTQVKVIAEGLNVRKGPSTQYESIGSVSKGHIFEAVGKSGSWYQVNYNGQNAYISGNLKYVEPTVINEYETLEIGTTTTGLNVRSGESTAYEKIGYLAKGSKVEIIKQASSGWYKIKYNGSYGYISNKYVSLNSNSSPDSTPLTTKQGQTTADLNVRSGDSTSYNIIGTLAQGEKIEIVEQSPSGWYKIKYNGSYGYVSNSYVRAVLDKFLFVGDSYTYLLRNTINSNAKNCVVKGKSGCVPSYWIKNFDSMPTDSSIDGVCVLLGVNGMNAAEYNTTVKDMKTLINKLSSKYPKKTIYIQKVFPLGRKYSKTVINRISNYNNEIEQYCKTISNVKFIDATNGFVDSDGYLKYPDAEGIHIIPSKYQMFFDNIGKAILNTI